MHGSLPALVVARPVAALVKLRSVLGPVEAVLLLEMQALENGRHLIGECLAVTVRKRSGVLNKANEIVG